MNKEHADKISLFARLLQFMSVEDAKRFNANDTAFILADPGKNIGALLEEVKNSKEWQEMSYKASHYDRDVAAAGGEAEKKLQAIKDALK